MNENVNTLEETAYKLGDLVTFISHPFYKDSLEIVIKGKAEYTGPILSIFEINNPNLYNEQTGLKEIQYHCIYFNSKTGLFEKKWFKKQQLKLIESYDNLTDKISIDSTPEDSLELINKKLILQTVDIELGKTKSSYEKKMTESNKLTAHLDFLPPVLIVLDVIKNENKKIYDCKTGLQNKPSTLIKVKWYNHMKQCFSEDLIPSCVLRNISQLHNSSLLSSFDKEKYYVIKNKYITLGSAKFPDVISIDEICYNSYYYEILGKSIYTSVTCSNKISNDLYNNMEKIELENIFGSDKLGFGNDGIFRKLTPKSFEIGKIYKMIYKNKIGKISERIILVNKIIVLNSSLDQLNEDTKKNLSMDELDATHHYYIEANCLLRNNETRHFRISSDSVFSIKEVLHDVQNQ